MLTLTLVVLLDLTGPQSEVDAGVYNGSFTVTSASGNVFTYQMQSEPSGNAVGSNITVKTEIDTVDSASPYAFNLSLRSVWGMNGMNANGAKQLVSNQWLLLSSLVYLFRKMIERS